MLTCTKTYREIPFAHRQHKHDGHCRFIHGHNWSFTFVFTATKTDDNGFVIDFGKLKWLKEWIMTRFDHALVLNEEDPFAVHLKDALQSKKNGTLASILFVPDASCEGIAKYLHLRVNEELTNYGYSFRGVRVTTVIVHEDERNSATYTES